MTENEEGLENLQIIRETMERSSAITRVSGVGMVGMGIIASIGAYLAPLQSSDEARIYSWMMIAILACGTGIASTWQQSRTRGPMIRLSAGRRFGLALAPPIIAGCILTAVFLRTAQFDLIPGSWMLLYGAGVITAGALSIRLIPIMGVLFMIFGMIGLYLPASWYQPFWQHMALIDFYLGAVFGGVHMLFGVVIAMKCNS